VTIRGGSCASPGGLVVRARWDGRFTGGTSHQTRTLTSSMVAHFRLSWARGGAIAIVANNGHTACKALVQH